MSALLFPDDIRFLQRTLCAAGCSEGPCDGVWNEATDVAEGKFDAIGAQLAEAIGRFDGRSERNIATLHPRAQELARQLLKRLRVSGVEARVISGTRTYVEQNRLYRIGRFGDTRKPVTNARAGASNHNFGIAWDIGIFHGGTYITDDTAYRAAAQHRPAGTEWGGDWHSFPDPPHYQIALSLPVNEVRSRFETGRRIVET